MAARKSSATKTAEPAAPKPKAAAKKSAAPKKKAAAPKATASKAAETKAAPKTAAPKTAAPKKAAPKKAAPVKLSDKQTEFLKTIQNSGAEGGYLLTKKGEQRTIDALLDRKLIKRGAKDKASGNYRYSISKTGEKHMKEASSQA